MDDVADWFRWLNQAHGINLSLFYDAYDGWRFVGGLLTTMWLSAIAIAASIALGIFGAWLQGSPRAGIRRGVAAYVQFFRNTPPLVQLYFFYFAVGGMLPRVTDAHGAQVPPIGSFAWAAITLSLFAGAINVEVFRAGLEAVPRTMVEAAKALGLSRFGIFRLVILPLALRISLPSLTNNLVNLVKTTTLAYAIGVPELLYASAQIWSEEFNVRETMTVMLIAYVGLVGLLVWGMARWERAWRIPGYAP
jgi:polar amino acid transport system permease protein